MEKEILDTLGFTQEELRDRVVDRIVGKLTEGHVGGYDDWIEAEFFSKVQEETLTTSVT